MSRREAVYDERISPLMVEIIRICKDAGIPMYASFSLDGDLACTTYIANRERVPEAEREDFDKWEAEFGRLANNVRPERATLMVTVRDASGQITSMEAIL